MLQNLYNDGTFASEYEDTHLYSCTAHGAWEPSHHKQIDSYPEDMKGMRIRRPSAAAGDIIESMGALL